MIRFLQGNLFDSQAEALVNTVNCAGVMGKGIAYQFKRSFPESSAEYMRRCKHKEVQLGKVTVSRESGRWIVQFPTKQHWKSPSRLRDIEDGLVALRLSIIEHKIDSIAIPPLGCGNGGLRWAEVKPLIQHHLGGLDRVCIDVYEPAIDSSNLQSKVARKPKLPLSAVVVAAVCVRLSSSRKLALQKALYFFDVYAKHSYFEFVPHHYGPWCPDVDRLTLLIKDYLDFTGISRDALVDQALRQELSGADAERLQRWLPAIDAATRLVNEEGPLIEALATVHAILSRSAPNSLDESRVVQQFFSWSDQKSEKFTVSQVQTALRALARWELARPGLLGWESAEPSRTPARQAG